MRPINEIVIHCTATRADWREGQKTSTKVREIKRWHTDLNGWSDIGYHFLIDRDGTRATGRPIEKTGAHVKGHNTGTIGISLFGGHGSAASDKFEDHFTEDQDRELRKLISEIRAKYGTLKISGHNQYAAKACPGFDAPKWFERSRPREPGPTVETPEYSGKEPTGWGVIGALLAGLVALIMRKKK